MTGPILTRPPLVIDPSVLATKPEGAELDAIISKAFSEALTEQAAFLEQVGKPELERMQSAWKRIEPQLLKRAGVDQQSFEIEVSAWAGELANLAHLPPDERRAKVAAVKAALPASLAKVAAAITHVPALGASVALMGTLRLIGAFDLGALSAIEILLALEAADACQQQTLQAPYAIIASSNIDTVSGGDFFVPDQGWFDIRVSGGVVGVGHKAVVMGSRFVVRDSDSHVSVSATLSNRKPGGGELEGASSMVAGAGYSHAWSQLILTINPAEATNTEITSTVTEPRNIMVVVGYDNEMPDPGEVDTYTLTCSFDRSPGDPLEYVATVQASVDVTIVAFGGAQCYLGLALDQIQVQNCPSG